MSKRILAFLLIFVLTAMSIVPAFAASGLSSDEESLLKKFEKVVNEKSDIIGNSAAAQWKTEAENALIKLDLNKDECAELSSVVDEAYEEIKDVKTKKEMLSKRDSVLSLVNDKAAKYGISVSVSTDGYAVVSIKTDAGSTIVAETATEPNQTGFGLARTGAVCAVIAMLVGGAYAVAIKKKLFA